MDPAYLVQLAVSAAAVALMVALAAWATHGRGAAPLDEATARRWLADEFPGCPVEALWVATDGKAALAKSGDQAFVLSRIGDGYAARRIAWAQALAASVRDGRVRIRLGDPAAPRALIVLAAWPPKEFAA
ncbi:MAG: hypothetical protein ACHP9T_06910 [Caulobacterales bacterium]